MYHYGLYYISCSSSSSTLLISFFLLEDHRHYLLIYHLLERYYTCNHHRDQLAIIKGIDPPHPPQCFYNSFCIFASRLFPLSMRFFHQDVVTIAQSLSAEVAFFLCTPLLSDHVIYKMLQNLRRIYDYPYRGPLLPKVAPARCHCELYVQVAFY